MPEVQPRWVSQKNPVNSAGVMRGNPCELVPGFEHEPAEPPGDGLGAIADLLLGQRDRHQPGHSSVLPGAGNQLVQPWIDSTLAALATRTGMTLAKAAQDLSPSVWWDEFAAAYGTRQSG